MDDPYSRFPNFFTHPIEILRPNKIMYKIKQTIGRHFNDVAHTSS